MCIDCLWVQLSTSQIDTSINVQLEAMINRCINSASGASSMDGLQPGTTGEIAGKDTQPKLNLSTTNSDHSHPKMVELLSSWALATAFGCGLSWVLVSEIVPVKWLIGR